MEIEEGWLQFTNSPPSGTNTERLLSVSSPPRWLALLSRASSSLDNANEGLLGELQWCSTHKNQSLSGSKKGD